MLPKPLIDILTNWTIKDLGLPNNSRHKSLANPSLQGEFLIVVRREVKLFYPGINATINHQKIFPTSVASSNDTDKVNIKADEYRLNRFLDYFDEEFIKKVIDAESKAFEQFNPPGFF